MGKDRPGLGKVSTGAQEGVAVGQALISEQSTEGSELPQYLEKLKTATLGDFFFINRKCLTQKDKTTLKRSTSSVNSMRKYDFMLILIVAAQMTLYQSDTG